MALLEAGGGGGPFFVGLAGGGGGALLGFFVSPLPDLGDTSLLVALGGGAFPLVSDLPPDLESLLSASGFVAFFTWICNGGLAGIVGLAPITGLTGGVTLAGAAGLLAVPGLSEAGAFG
jgi:hypothetical protein